MKLQGRQKIMRIYVDERDTFKGTPLYEAIVDKAWKLGLAGATAFKGVIGYGCKHHVQAAAAGGVDDHVPVCVEIVETKENLEKIRPALDEMITAGLIVIEDAEVVLYRTEGTAAK